MRKRPIPVLVPFLAMAGLATSFWSGSCASSSPPPPEGDTRARAIAEDVLERMGGEQGLEHARFVCWRFFGRRFHVWDRESGAARLEQGSKVVFHNVNHPYDASFLGGQVFDNGVEILDSKLRAEELERAYAAWVNDSYWLFMPYKLLDPGVELTYRGVAELEPGRPADVLRLSFQQVGLTPQNLYDVYVAQDTGLVERWDFYPDASAQEPKLSTPWLGWKRYGEILLSGDRGEFGSLTDIAVFEELSSDVFKNPAAKVPLPEASP